MGKNHLPYSKGTSIKRQHQQHLEETMAVLVGAVWHCDFGRHKGKGGGGKVCLLNSEQRAGASIITATFAAAAVLEGRSMVPRIRMVEKRTLSRCLYSPYCFDSLVYQSDLASLYREKGFFRKGIAQSPLHLLVSSFSRCAFHQTVPPLRLLPDSGDACSLARLLRIIIIVNGRPKQHSARFFSLFLHLHPSRLW
ncbi:MAG: hypothetical protein INR71_10515 [Terriglobus roseus]|nr:hypothetical protein [Terriglobus roseus]